MFCTPEEIDAGLKSIEVQYRSGRSERITLRAPTRREIRQARLDLVADADHWHIIKFAVAPRDERWLDSLTPESADLVENVALTLAFGIEYQKKMMEAIQRLATAIQPRESSPTSAPNNACSVPDTPSTTPGT